MKPPKGTPINPDHPLSKGLIFACLFNEGEGLIPLVFNLELGVSLGVEPPQNRPIR